MLYFKTINGRGLYTNSFFVSVEANILKKRIRLKRIRLKNVSFGMRCKIFMGNHILKIHVKGKFKLHPTEKNTEEWKQ